MSLSALIPKLWVVVLCLAIGRFHSGLGSLRRQLVAQVKVEVTHVSFFVFKRNLFMATTRFEVCIVQAPFHVFDLLLSFQRFWINHLLKLVSLLKELLPVLRVVFLRQVDFDSLLVSI